MGFGKPKHGSAFKQVLTLKENAKLRVRILPPMHSLEDKGLWSVNHRQHFGYSVPSRQEPGKSMPRPFYCVEKKDFRSNTITQVCAECNRIREMKDRLETLKKSYKEKGESDARIAEHIKPLNNWLQKHNLDNKQYYNVKLVDGSYTTVKFAWSVKKELDKLVRSLYNPEDKSVEAVDAIDKDQGVWFDVSRTGTGFKTEYEVKVVTDTIHVEIGGKKVPVQQIKSAPLSEEDYTKALEACHDLADVGIPSLSPERVAILVAGNGEPEEVEAAFATPEKVEETSPPAAAAPVASTPVASASKQLASAAAPTAVEESPVSTEEAASVDNEVVYGDPSEMTQEEFLKLYGSSAKK